MKGLCHEIFDTLFSRPLIKRLKYFQSRFQYRSNFKKAPPCASHHGVKLHSVHHPARSIYAVCIIPHSQTLRCASHQGVKIEIFVSLWLLLKGQSREILLGVNTEPWTCLSWKKRCEEIFFKLLSLKFALRCIKHTAESNFSNFVIEYLGKIETEFENTLACLSRAQMGSKHEKNGGRKSCDTLNQGKIVWVIQYVHMYCMVYCMGLSSL